MKKRLRCTSCLLALLMALQLFCGGLLASAVEEAAVYYITPQLSDGIAVEKEELDNLYVKGNLQGDTFTFSEDKTLSFTATFGEGWSYHEAYSCFFPDDEKNVSIRDNPDGTVTFAYTAKKGGAIDFLNLENVILNAAAEKLPRLDINLKEGSFSSVNKDDWVAADFKLTEGSKKFKKGGNYEGTGEVKGRGNSSWQQPQRPYSIKLSDKESLLDIPKTKKYAIITSYIDPSLMRNYITYKSSLKLQGIDYVPKVEFVEVYLNGQYNGVYSFVERIDIESTKVDIEEADDEHLTGGYIIEKDTGGKVNTSVDPWFKCPYQAHGDDLFTLKAPDPTEAMLSYLEQHMQKLHDALMGISGEDYQKYIDNPSWADFLIIQELSKNIDGNLKTSCYLVKDRDSDVVSMTAPWDFDLAYGQASYSNGTNFNDRVDCPTGTGTDAFMVINSSCPWYKQLYQKQEFSDLVKEKYSAYRYDMVEDMQKMINEQAAYLSVNAAKNREKWPAMADFDQSVAKLRDWLNGRVAWLDGQWLQSEEQHGVTIRVTGEGTADGGGVVAHRSQTTLSVMPKEGHYLKRLAFNGIDVTGQVQNGVYHTPILTGDAVIEAQFARILSGDATLSALSYQVNGGESVEVLPFSAENENVFVELPREVPRDAKITLLPTLSSEYAALLTDAPSLTLTMGKGEAEITVKAENGIEKSYHISFTTIPFALTENSFDGISDGSSFTLGEQASFVAVGAGMDNQTPADGDIRYRPSSFAVAFRSGEAQETVASQAWSEDATEFAGAFDAQMAGEYQLKVTFVQEKYELKNDVYGFIPTGEELVKTVAFSVTPKPTYALVVSGGSGSGSYLVGQEILIEADGAPAGKAFDKWVLASGEGSIKDASAAETVFVMTESDAQITATYKDAPKDDRPEPDDTQGKDEDDKNDDNQQNGEGQTEKPETGEVELPVWAYFMCIFTAGAAIVCVILKKKQTEKQ